MNILNVQMASLILPFVKVAEDAAIEAFNFAGLGNNDLADKAAVDSMRYSLNKLPLKGVVVIGEGERDEAPMLYIGEEVGNGMGPEIDIALDPLEGTTICANYGPGSLTVIAYAPKGGFLNAPDVYMDKIVAPANTPKEILNFDDDATTIIKNLCAYKKCESSSLLVTILNRKRHESLIAKIYETGARVKLIEDGDIAAAINVNYGKHRPDLYLGSGGGPEGVLAACAIQALGGEMVGRLILDSATTIKRAKKMGIVDYSKTYTIDELASKNSVFVACGVTDGELLKGVKNSKNTIKTSSLVITSLENTSQIRIIKSTRLI